MLERNEVREVAEAERKSSGVAVRVLAAFGLFQLYNIVGHYQTVVELSRSFKLIAGWWHFGVRTVFEFFYIHLEQWQREVLVLLAIAISAANLRYRQDHGKWLVTEVARSAADPNNSKIGPEIFESGRVALLYSRATLAMSLLISVALLLAPKSATTVIVVTAVILSAILLQRLFARNRRSFGEALGYCLVVIPFYLTLWLFALYRYRVSILKTLRYLLLFLVADVAFRYGIDPLVRTWPDLPTPPSPR